MNINNFSNYRLVSAKVFLHLLPLHNMPYLIVKKSHILNDFKNLIENLTNYIISTRI